MLFSPTQRITLQVHAARDRAEAMLQGLEEARRELDRFGPRGITDPMRRVTGRLTVDLAIRSVRRLIRSLNRATHCPGNQPAKLNRQLDAALRQLQTMPHLC